MPSGVGGTNGGNITTEQRGGMHQRAHDEALVRTGLPEVEPAAGGWRRSSISQRQPRSSGLEPEPQPAPMTAERPAGNGDGGALVSSQERRDRELARQFEAFGVFAGSSHPASHKQNQQQYHQGASSSASQSRGGGLPQQLLLHSDPPSASSLSRENRDITVSSMMGPAGTHAGRGPAPPPPPPRDGGSPLVALGARGELHGMESSYVTAREDPAKASRMVALPESAVSRGGSRQRSSCSDNTFRRSQHGGGDKNPIEIHHDPPFLERTSLFPTHQPIHLGHQSSFPGSAPPRKNPPPAGREASLSAVDCGNTSSSVDESLAYARHLQEQAFRTIQQQRHQQQSDHTRDDLELARRMQELEDKGLGRLNSRRFQEHGSGGDGDEEDDPDESDDDSRGGCAAAYGIPFMAAATSSPRGVVRSLSSSSSQEDEDARLARYMQGGGTSIRNLTKEAVDQLLGQNSVGDVAQASRHTGPASSSSSRAAEPVEAPWQSSSRRGDAAAAASISPLMPEAFLDIPQRERKKKKGFLGFGWSERKAPAPAVAPPTAQPAIEKASAVPSVIPSPLGGPPCAIPPPPRGPSGTVGHPRRLSSLNDSFPSLASTAGHDLSAPPVSPVVLTEYTPVSAPHSAPVGPRPTVGRQVWTPSSPRRTNPRAEINARSLSPLPATQRPGPLPHSVSVSRSIAQAPVASAATAVVVPRPTSSSNPAMGGGRVMCATCRQSGGSFVAALDKRYHVECFRCLYCNDRIDPSSPFSFSRDNDGEKHPYHRKCFSELYGVTCAVCSTRIPSNMDGTVTFVKHPFFDTEHMCLHHAGDPGRRCTGCHRFEPIGSPFADLNDGDRCVCYSCCRTVVVDNVDVSPLWERVLGFFEHNLNLPVWKEMRDIPILVVQSDALSDQMRSDNAHFGSSQIMARGLCLTDHDHNRRFKLPSMRFINSSRSFAAVEAQGYTYFDFPESAGGRQHAGNPNSNVFAILCLSGLPRDLTISVLAHEATHAWIKLHPNYDSRRPLPAQVEEGCAQLVAMLLLTDGLDAPNTTTDTAEGPSDEKLRQYFKFSIERDHDEVYGGGYRKAARAYSDIGIEALLSHVVRYGSFPST